MKALTGSLRWRLFLTYLLIAVVVFGSAGIFVYS